MLAEFRGWMNSRRPRKLTLLGRAMALIVGELLFNAACWIAAGICFSSADGILGFALLAWTIGLRHGLDADHISAIDNATRQLVSQGQLPITCGLFFSLGHSTIVIIVNTAIAISVDIYDKLDKVGSIGGIIGTSVSASFLFFIACLNIYFLVGTIKHRRAIKCRQVLDLPAKEAEGDPSTIYGGGCIVRVVGPILRVVDRPWKMYPVGVLFGFGFDTASSIALLAISAVAQRGPRGESISHGKIVILPLLFTAGMSLVDSLDSILMLYAYAAPSRSTPEGRLSLFQGSDDKDELLADTAVPTLTTESDDNQAGRERERSIGPMEEVEGIRDEDVTEVGKVVAEEEEERVGDSSDMTCQGDAKKRRVLTAKSNTMSSLSILLTFLSILVAFSISLIEIMGLIGENCTQCQKAAENPNGSGLAGRWWRTWTRANDQSGYIGAAIVGCFTAILFGWYAVKWGLKKWKCTRK
nr:high-affinity nickel-transporter [Cryptococcus depauperatus CBS 7841]